MSKPQTDDAFASLPDVVTWQPAEVRDFRRVLERLDKDGLCVARGDIERVEAFWSFDDGDYSSLGVVLRLRSSCRVCVYYSFDFCANVEEIEVQPMGDERYPASEGDRIEWNDDADELNRLLMS